MIRLLYPLFASALITIAPFLITFEKGQNIVRGIAGFDTFAIILLFIWARQNTPKKVRRPQSKCLWLFVTISLAFTLILDAEIDLQYLMAQKGQNGTWQYIIPVSTSVLAIMLTWKTKPFKFAEISFILFTALIIHLLAFSYYPSQPLFQYPLINHLEQFAPSTAGRSNLPETFRKHYLVTDSASITKNYLDTTRTNILILVESWGIPLDSIRFKNQLSLFNGIPMLAGAHHRMYSRTRTAEREDLIYKINRDSVGRRDTIFIPDILQFQGIQTSFIYGGDSTEHQRNKYIYKVGFEKIHFAKNDEKKLADSQIFLIIDSLLQNPSAEHPHQFIAWTTRDTKFPFQNLGDNPYTLTATAIDSTYTQKLRTTLLLIANLAHKYPQVRFIAQGDHNPILSPKEFQEHFYKRWVPFVVLN